MSVLLQPKLRFKEFSIPWKIDSIGNIGKATMCKRIFANETSTSGDIPFYKIGTFGKKPDAYISKEKYFEYKEKYKYPKKGEILISASGTIGRTVIFNGEPSYFQDSNIIWIDNNEIRVKNIFLELLYKNVNWKPEGAILARLYNSNLEGLNLSFPTLEEQEKIASFLSSVDKKIELLTKKHELLEKYKKGLMQKIFSQEIRFKQDDGSDFPDWEVKQLEDIAVSKSSNLSENKLTRDGGNYKVYGATGCLFNLKEYLFEEPYISIVKDGAGVGRALLCDAKSSIIGTLIALIPKADIEINFLYYLFTRINLRKYIVGSSIPHIYFKDYKKERIFLPSNLEQQKIASFLSSIDKKIDLAKLQIEKTQTFKKGLLQQMFV